jgi:hypothetical protein
MHPQGKDQYDAVLLAEDVILDLRLLRDVLQHSDTYDQFHGVGLAEIAQLGVEPGWEHFQGEYPLVPGSAQQWTDRLCAALTPTFTVLNESRMRAAAERR